jgi:hypothetical protein
MHKALSVVAIAATIGASMTSVPSSARADNGRIATGILGGLAVGTLLGAATAPRPYYYYAPAPVYVEPAPVYEGPRCYWTRGEPVWDDSRGVWYRPRMQVCD